MTENDYETNDEIDLSELLTVLWYYKIWIAVITSLFIFVSGYYALTTTKQYTATAIFQIEQNRSNSLTIPSDFGALASLAGFGSVGDTNSEILIERMLEREFILKVSQILSLQNDTFFQTYNPKAADPNWKAEIKKLIGWEKSNANRQSLIDSTIQKNYLEYVKASQTPGGAIKIFVKHEDPKLAAKYANQIMELVRETVASEKDKSKEIRLSYLAESLADALQDMEIAQQNIKNYTLENSAAAQENF